MKPIHFQRWGSAVLAPSIRRPDQCLCLAVRASGYSIITRHQSTVQLVSPLAQSESSRGARKGSRHRKPPADSTLTSTVAAVAPATSTPTSYQPDDASIIWEQVPSPITSQSEPLIPSSQPLRPPPSPAPQERRADVTESTFNKEKLPSPRINTRSPKLTALHARLSLSSRIPVQTLARCLVDETADPDYRFNNRLLAQFGCKLLNYHVSEYLICHYPRLPMAILSASMDAYVGASALRAVSHDWGVEHAAEPGGEVDPGLLQFRRELPTKRVKDEVITVLRRFTKSRAAEVFNHGRKVTDARKAGLMNEGLTATLDQASRSFVRAVFGAIYLHCGAAATQDFVNSHILSRHLDLSSLFTFQQPTRDLSRLCAREGFEPPVARLISETGRLSRHPVFVVGIFSGRDKLGEDAGASLDEARFRAATAALRGWYLYSPKTENGEIVVPSKTIGETGPSQKFQPLHVDDGEVIV